MSNTLKTPLSSNVMDRFRRTTAQNGQSMAEVNRQLILDYCNREELIRTKLD